MSRALTEPKRAAMLAACAVLVSCTFPDFAVDRHGARLGEDEAGGSNRAGDTSAGSGGAMAAGSGGAGSNPGGSAGNDTSGSGGSVAGAGSAARWVTVAKLGRRRSRSKSRQAPCSS